MYSENTVELSSSDSETNEPSSKESACDDLKQDIDCLIKHIKNVQLKYVVSGKAVEAPLVVISIKETNEKIHFPMYVDDKSSIDVFKVSPFGKGTETVIDTQIRNSLELNATEFEIINPNWNSFLNENLIPRIREEMTLHHTFKASLHKLLLYRCGSFFKPHRDSEKEAGMFGTLVIQLPSKYEGGQLIVKHNGQTEEVDFSSTKDSTNEFSTYFTAFYCDCEHEVLQVTNGIRICLVYNMLSTSSNSTNIPTVPSIRNIRKMKKLKSLLNEWFNTTDKLVYCFDHQYTESSLSFVNLKSTDYEIARLFKNLATECSLEIMFGLLKKETQGYGSDFDSDDGNYKELSLECLKSIDNKTFIDSMSVDFDEDVIPDNCFENIYPHNTKENRNTGNCGVEVTRFYHLAVMVVLKK